MVKIYCGQFGLGILLLVKNYTTNLLAKIYTINLLVKFPQLIYWSNIVCGQFGQGMLLMVKIYIINLLIKIYVRTVWSENIDASINLHNKITGKNLYSELFIKTSVN
jgi:hypothetical protein